jgi:16S rRNA (adenine(1408)-N(1))-methyltransferase
VRRVVGRRVSELDVEHLTAQAAKYTRTVVDVGTGGGTALMRRARRQPTTFFVGIDANAERMREASHRARRSPQRGGAPNAAFVAASAEDLPGPLAASADEVTVVLPWGSLMRGVLTADGVMVARLTGLLRGRGRLELLLSIVETDAGAEMPALDENGARALAAEYGRLGLTVEEVRLAEEADIDRLGSSWGRRLGIPTHRQAWILRFVT